MMDNRKIDVLVIEDNPGDVLLIRELLNEVKGGSFVLTIANRLSSAIKKLNHKDVDVILCDLSLPDSSGLTTFIEVHKIAQNIPIIVLSGLDDEDLALLAVQKGAQDYLVKGQVDSNLLARSIRYSMERNQITEELRESQEKLKRILESSPESITVMSLDGNIIECNQASIEMLGFTDKNELMAKNGFDFFAPKDKEHAAWNLKEVLKTGTLRSIEYNMRDQKGREFPSELSAAVIRNSTGIPTSLVIISKDISERKRTLQQLIHSEKLAGIGTLAAGIAHEINNPLTGIIGYAEILMKARNPDLTMQYAKMIMNQAYRTADIVRWLSNYSRSAKNTQSKDMYLNLVIKESLEALRHTRKSHDLKIIKDLQNVPKIKGNKSELEQVFVNIMSNAVDAMPNGGTLGISSVFTGDKIMVKISDNGTGIEKDRIPRIFDPFFTTKEVGKGTGLGLYVSSMIMKKHHGTIHVESEPQNGTTFTLSFPTIEALS